MLDHILDHMLDHTMDAKMVAVHMDMYIVLLENQSTLKTVHKCYNCTLLKQTVTKT